MGLSCKSIEKFLIGDFMFKFLYVGLGGTLGAILRYSFSFLPIASNKTIFINIIGAIVIGFVSFFSKNIRVLDQRLFLFLTTGLCGGFTTFSTFSLETVQLIEKNEYFLALLYSLGTVVLSLIGIYIGYYLAKLF